MVVLFEALQPHEGSSETRSRPRYSIRLRSLQPHEGSSETCTQFDFPAPFRPLQPHEGSSETVEFSHAKMSFPCFNPTRVRLKRSSCPSR